MENGGFRESKQRERRRRDESDLLVQMCTFSLLFKWAACIFSKNAETNLASCTKSTLTLSEESRKRSSLKQKLRPDFIFGEIYGRLLVEETAV